MIDFQVKIHDNYSLEFKVGFRAQKNVKINDFIMNSWIFVPHNLDIDSSSYDKTQFYRDIKSNLRLITPVFMLRDIAQGNAIPLQHLEASFRQLASDASYKQASDYVYQIKMFAAIFKSALRDLVQHILHPQTSGRRSLLIEECLRDIRTTLANYRALSKIISVPTVSHELFEYFRFGDEFMCNVTEFQLFKLADKLRSAYPEVYEASYKEILALITEENAYQTQSGYLTVRTDSPNQNRDMVYRRGMLKKFIESDLFLNANKKRQGVITEHIYLSIAAGVSMIFATAVSFIAQSRYGNFTIPFFLALVISYMFKDRIKDLMRYYFAAHKKGTRYFDNKTTVSIKSQEVGWCKEGFDFIEERKVPRDILQRRSRSSLLQADNIHSHEKIILYRKLMRIDREALDLNAQYNLEGINDIYRFNLMRFIQNMDNPELPLYYVSNQEQIMTVMGAKVYYLNFIIQLKEDDKEELMRYRVVLDRNGIRQLETL